ncbi:MAG: TlyA family RNA methyltransferase [Salaquimonas sp.]
MNTSKKYRLDQFLVEKHGYESRSRARDAILRGCISVDGSLAKKPSQTVLDDHTIGIDDPAGAYVSRAALKLVHALDASGLSVEGRIAVDLGASTGGFTQVLLERGAAHVFSIDVGHGQFHSSLEDNSKITKIENLNVRDLTHAELSNIHPDLLVSDLSFISLKLALPPALSLAANPALGIFLIKPQFEVGKDGLGSGGIVRDESLIEETVSDISNWMNDQPHWSVTDIFPSPIQGGDGNKEFLMIARKEIRHE